ncbi:MAG: Myxococcales trans domain protein, partial [bacterium]|nr:Myxococcales trans domain protein [bacterium]
MKRLSALSCQLSALLIASAAGAQSANPGVAVERFVPALGPTALVGVEGSAVTRPGALSWAAGIDLLHDPITLRAAYTGDLVSRPVRDQLVGDVALEFGVWKRLALAVGVPVVLYQDGDRLRGTGVDERALQATAAGDLRFRIKGALVDGKWLGAALVLQVTAPAGGQSDFAATDGATIEPRLVVDARLGRVTLALQAGARFQKDRTLFLTRFGDELVWGAAAALSIVERATAGVGAIVEGAGAVGPSL